MIALLILIPTWFAASVIFAVIFGRAIHLRDTRETPRARAEQYEVAA